MFAKPNLNSFDFFDLIWAVGITDFVLKYFTIGLKCFVLFLPKILLAFKSRVRNPQSSLPDSVLFSLHTYKTGLNICRTGIRHYFCKAEKYH